MLEVTILKTSHSGEQEARKLLPYVKGTDVFSLEAFHPQMTSEVLAIQEKRWAELISSGMSRTRFAPILERMFTSFGDPDARSYLLKTYEYLFRNNVFLYHVERYNKSDEIAKIKALWDEGNFFLNLGINSLRDGDFEGGSRNCFKGGLLHSEFRAKRDKNIANHISFAENQLRNLYQKLKEKENITLCVQIGAAHKPELYLQMPRNVIDLIDGSQLDFWSYPEIDSLMRSNPTYEQFVPLLKSCLLKRPLKDF